MKHIKYSATFLLLIMLLLNACQKDLDYFVPDPTQNLQDTNWYNNITDTMPVVTLKNNLLLPLQNDSIILSNNSSSIVSFPSGLQVNIGANSLGINGQFATGSISVETILLKKKGDMIRMDKPTVSNGYMLVSGGSMFVSIKNNGTAAGLLPNRNISFTYPDSPVSNQMKLFYGAVNGDQFNWLPSPDSMDVGVYTSGIGGQTYQVISGKLDWINCDHFYDTTVPKIPVTASLPVQYTNANSVAYLVFNDIRSVIGMYGNATTKKFKSIYVPLGLSVTVVVISKQGNDYYLGHETTTTTSSSQLTQTVDVLPVKTTLDGVKAYLDGL